MSDIENLIEEAAISHTNKEASMPGAGDTPWDFDHVVDSFKAGAKWALEHAKSQQDSQRFIQYMTDMQTDFANRSRK